jgi:hypothetical protein
MLLSIFLTVIESKPLLPSYNPQMALIPNPMKKIYLIFLLLFFPFWNGILHANDCSTANSINSVVLASTGTQSGSLASESWSGSAQCAGPGSQPDVWYSFAAQASTSYIQVAGGGDLDVVIEVFDACGGAQLICRNNTGAGGTETALINNLSVGNTYYFAVYHAGVDVPLTTTFTAVVAHIPEVELRSVDCDQFNYTTNSIIKANAPVASSFTITGYQWRFEELDAPFNTYEVVSPNGTNPNYRMKWFAPAVYGMSYDVSVRLLVAEGSSAGDYGNVCSIGFQANVLSTQLQAQFANGFFNFCNVVAADPVGVATQYRWAFNDLSTTTSVFGDLDSRLLRLQKVPGLKLGQVYIVSAFATVAGVESPQGLQRFITMNNFVPNTGLRQDLYPCGATYPINTQVQAVEVCSAQSYTWRFTNTSQAQSTILYTRSDGSRFIRLDWLTDLIVGDSYNVDVRASQGNLTGDYSAICNITIAASTAGIVGMFSDTYMDEAQSLLNASVIVEPVDAPSYAFDLALSGNDAQGNGLQVHLTNELASDVKVELFDLGGKMVYQERVRVEGQQDLRLNSLSLPKGVYLLRAYNGSEVKTQKIVL